MRDERRSHRVVGVRISRRAPWQRLILGLSILAAGVIFWLDHLGRIDARTALAWWPGAAIGMGVAHLFERRWFGAAIWLIVGTYFFLPLVGVSSAHVWYVIGVWPLLITFAGVILMMQALRRGAGEPTFRALAVMGGNVRRVGAEFTGGEAVAVMGACDIDLTNARVDTEAVIDVLAFWGGIGIRVPRGWRIVSRVTPILGGFDDKTEEAPDGAPRLVIRGSAIMGGIDVRHAKGIA